MPDPNATVCFKRNNIKVKAVICKKYGGPEVLKIKEVAKPVTKDNEVCVQIHATGVFLYNNR
ncbi:MAG: hypothetical protein AB9842_03580 [Bacteroidales bacterium]